MFLEGVITTLSLVSIESGSTQVPVGSVTGGSVTLGSVLGVLLMESLVRGDHPLP